jgi:hypothetical protein
VLLRHECHETPHRFVAKRNRGSSGTARLAAELVKCGSSIAMDVLWTDDCRLMTVD